MRSHRDNVCTDETCADAHAQTHMTVSRDGINIADRKCSLYEICVAYSDMPLYAFITNTQHVDGVSREACLLGASLIGLSTVFCTIP